MSINPFQTNKQFQIETPKQLTLNGEVGSGYTGLSDSVKTWFYHKRDEGIDITVNSEDQNYKVIGVVKDMKEAVIFVARSGETIFLIKFNKFDEVRITQSESGDIADIPLELSAYGEVESLKGFGTIIPMDQLFPLLLVNGELDIHLSEIKDKIKFIGVDEAMLRVTSVLGAGRMGVVLQVEIEDEFLVSDDPQDRLFVFKIGVTDAVVQDLLYELKAQQIVASRIGQEYVPNFRPIPYNISLHQENEGNAVASPIQRGLAIAMPQVKNSKALAKWDRDESTNATEVLGAYLETAMLSDLLHMQGIVNGDAHSRNMLITNEHKQVLIDFDQFRFVDFDITLAFQLLLSEDILPAPARTSLALSICQKIKHNSESFGLTEEDKLQELQELNQLIQVLSFYVTGGLKNEPVSQQSVVERAVNFMINNSISNIAFDLRNQSSSLVISLNTEVSDIIREYNIRINWNNVLKQRKDLWISPETKDDIFAVAHPRSMNHAVPLGGIPARDFNAIAASENRTKVLELMHALKLPFYSPLFDRTTGGLFSLSGADWNMNDENSFGYKDLIGRYYQSVMMHLSHLENGEFAKLFIDRDFFVSDAKANSKLADLSEQKLKVIWKILRDYFVEYDLIYMNSAGRRLRPEDAKHSNIVELITRIINVYVMDDNDARLTTDEVETLLVNNPTYMIPQMLRRDENGELLNDQSPEVLAALGIEP